MEKDVPGGRLGLWILSFHRRESDFNCISICNIYKKHSLYRLEGWPSNRQLFSLNHALRGNSNFWLVARSSY